MSQNYMHSHRLQSLYGQSYVRSDVAMHTNESTRAEHTNDSLRRCLQQTISQAPGTADV